MIQCRARRKTKAKQQNMKAAKGMQKKKKKRAKTKQSQLEVRLVRGPPGWFMASIPDGIAREDGNLTGVFFE